MAHRAAEWSIESNSYSAGCMLYSSSAVPRVVRTASIECFHGHTNGLCELTVVTGTWRSDESMGPTSHSLRPMLCSSSDVSRIVGNEIGLTTTPIECFHELISVVGT